MKKVNQAKLAVLDKFFENPTTSALEEEEMFVVEMFGRPEYKENFEKVKEKAPYVYKNLKMYRKAMDMTKRKYDRIKRGNVSRTEMVVAGYVANIMHNNTSAFVDTHVRFKPVDSNMKTATMRSAESDIIIEMEDNMTAILLDGIWHKIKEQDDMARTSIFKDNGCEVIRIRETGLPLMSKKVCESINLNESISTDEGCKEAAFELVNKLNEKFNLNIQNDEELFERVNGAPETYYEKLFNSEMFYASIPDSKRAKIENLFNKCSVIEGKRAKITRAQLKKEAKEMKISKNVKAAFASFAPDTFAVLRKYW